MPSVGAFQGRVGQQEWKFPRRLEIYPPFVNGCPYPHSKNFSRAVLYRRNKRSPCSPLSETTGSAADAPATVVKHKGKQSLSRRESYDSSPPLVTFTPAD
ncbi:hypothetical protein EI94DRAFT_1734032 [Lactarius quietus]|nr:hypothetical protein EI94DRAFT_1734032 [Lactarius quietus]